MMRLFINYKRNVTPDQDLAISLESALRQAGHEVFRDQTNIASGTAWGPTIMAELDRAEVVLSLGSNASLRSNWVLNEMNRALAQRKLILPILLEPLSDSLQFQEWDPRFSQIQQIIYRGDPTALAQEILLRLKLSPTLQERGLPTLNSFSFAEWDDSPNRFWPAFQANNAHLLVDGRYRFQLPDVIRLAQHRSEYYTRNLRAREAARSGDSTEPRTELEETSFEAFRQGFFTRVATGDLGLSAFSRIGPQSAVAQATGPVGGFLGLMLRQVELRSLQRCLAALQQHHELLSALMEGGLISVRGIDQVGQLIALKTRTLLHVTDALEEEADALRTYVLGLPEDVEVEFDHISIPWIIGGEEAVLTEVRDEIFRLRQGVCDGTVDLDGLDETYRDLSARIDARYQALANEVARLPRSALFRDPTESTPAGPQRLDLAGQLQSMHEYLHETMAEQAQRRDDPDPYLDPGPGERWLCEVERLRPFIDSLALFDSLLCLEKATVPPITLTLEQAEQLARTHRLDRAILDGDPTFQREVRRTLRGLLRQLRRLEKTLTQARRGLAIAIRQADMTKELMMAPPAPGGFGMSSVGEREGDPVTIAIAPYEAERDFLTYWLTYEALRARLYRELGLLRLNADGIWVDEAIPE